MIKKPNLAAQARRACSVPHETETLPRRCLTLPVSGSDPNCRKILEPRMNANGRE
jgi:hypothetical protein